MKVRVIKFPLVGIGTGQLKTPASSRSYVVPPGTTVFQVLGLARNDRLSIEFGRVFWVHMPISIAYAKNAALKHGDVITLIEDANTNNNIVELY